MSEDSKQLLPRSLKDSALTVWQNMFTMLNKEEGENFLALPDGTRAIPQKAFFLTSAGAITGEFPNPELDEETKAISFSRVFFEALNHNATFSSASGNVIPLKNVSIKTNTGHTYDFNEFMLFSEDVIGFHFVPKDYKL